MTWSATRVPRARLEPRSRLVIGVWVLLFVNVLAFEKAALVIPVPHKVGQLVTQGALGLALIWVLRANRPPTVRPSLFLGMYSLLALTSAMMSIRVAGIGTDYRAVRMVVFLVILWLLTPWWPSPDLVLLRAQLYVLIAITVSLFLGLAASPGKALAINYGAHRLNGDIWPIPATQVGHYMAEMCGMAAILWVSGMLGRRAALAVLVPGLAALLLSQTRTAVLGLAVGLVVGILSMFRTKRRVRKAFVTAVMVIIAVGVPLSPVVRSYINRGQTSQEVSGLSGRTKVWPLVLSEPRPELNKVLGSGLSNGSVINQPDPSVNGLPIDGSWIATYQDQGVFGIVLEAVMFLFLLVVAAARPPGVTRALALFLLSYCFLASFTETGMGGVSSYLLDLTLAASLLAPREYPAAPRR